MNTTPLLKSGATALCALLLALALNPAMAQVNTAWSTTATNIGIGTGSPSTKLQVAGYGTSNVTAVNNIFTAGDYDVLTIGDNPASGYFAAGLRFLSKAGSTTTYGTRLIQNGGRFDIWTGLGTQNQVMTLNSGGNVGFYGNVGLGTNSPSSRLTVQDGDLSVSIGADAGLTTLSDATTKTARVVMPHYHTADIPVSLLSANSSSTNNNINIGGGSTLANAATRINFFTGETNSTNTGTQRMVIDANGNVGIGTTSPDEKLAVNGTIHAREVKVNTTGWGDFVFDEDHRLRTLQEVQSYIQANHHLPGIPAAKEIEAKGLELGEMNKLLMIKIEELTLYLLEKDKALRAQAQTLLALSQRMEELEKALKPR